MVHDSELCLQMFLLLSCHVPSAVPQLCTLQYNVEASDQCRHQMRCFRDLTKGLTGSVSSNKLPLFPFLAAILLPFSFRKVIVLVVLQSCEG